MNQNNSLKTSERHSRSEPGRSEKVSTAEVNRHTDLHQLTLSFVVTLDRSRTSHRILCFIIFDGGAAVFSAE